MTTRPPLISIIVAMDSNNLIGNKNDLPWHIPGELSRFKKITMGKPIIMGRKTHESIGKILKGRINIVLSKNPSFKKKDIFVFNNLKDALENFKTHKEIMIIGGEGVFKLAIPLAKKIYITQIHQQFEGDVWFPNINYKQWEVITREDCFSKEKEIKYSYLICERISE